MALDLAGTPGGNVPGHLDEHFVGLPLCRGGHYLPVFVKKLEIAQMLGMGPRTVRGLPLLETEQAGGWVLRAVVPEDEEGAELLHLVR